MRQVFGVGAGFDGLRFVVGDRVEFFVFGFFGVLGGFGFSGGLLFVFADDGGFLLFLLFGEASFVFAGDGRNEDANQNDDDYAHCERDDDDFFLLLFLIVGLSVHI